MQKTFALVILCSIIACDSSNDGQREPDGLQPQVEISRPNPANPQDDPRQPEAQPKADKPQMPRTLPAQTPEMSYQLNNNVFFKVRKDGFRFGNYTKTPTNTNLKPRTVERLCGKRSCVRGQGDSCELTPAMARFMQQANKELKKGHCEGMSTKAQLLFQGRIPLSQFDRNAKSTHDLKRNNERLLEEIAFWHSTQFTDPLAESELRISPREVLERLKDRSERYSISISDKNGRKGHTISPVRVIETSPNSAQIQVYDSNDPDDEQQFIYFNLRDNTWEYQDEYEGDARTLNLTLVPFSARIVQQTCPPGGNLDFFPDEAADGDEDSYDSEDDDSEEEYDDDDGEVWVDGDGYVVPPPGTRWRSIRSTPTKSSEPIYIFPLNKKVKLSVVGKEKVIGAPTNLTIFSRGQAIMLDGIALEPGEKDTVSIGSNASSIKYNSKDDEDLSIGFAMTYKGADYDIRLSPQIEDGFEFYAENKIDSKGKHQFKVSLSTQSKKAARFTIELTRADTKSDQVFTHRKVGVLVAPNETVVMEYGKWLRDGQPLSILRDTDSDDKIDSTHLVKDED